MNNLDNCYTVKINGHTEYFTTESSALAWAKRHGVTVIHPSKDAA